MSGERKVRWECSVGPTAYGSGLREGRHKRSAAELGVGVGTGEMDLGKQRQKKMSAGHLPGFLPVGSCGLAGDACWGPVKSNRWE